MSMTESEAIGMIKDDLLFHSKDLSSKYKKALKMAVDLLENQIPKTPTKGNVIYRCGVCNHDVYLNWRGCPICLNVIDWSEGKE